MSRCHLIYYCLDYFSKIINLKNIINDVILLAGATTIYDYNIKRIVEEFDNGRFINCYNKNDNMLFISQLFSEFLIGLREIDGAIKLKIMKQI